MNQLQTVMNVLAESSHFHPNKAEAIAFVKQMMQAEPVAWARPDAVDASQDFRFIKIDDFTQALFTHPAPQAVPVWLPIESAPKDGEWALVYADGSVNCAFVKQGALPKDWCGATMWNINPSQVTHWMPLPAAPKGGVA